MGAEPDKSPGDPATKKESSNFTKKMVKIVTVMAYISAVSGAGFLLSLYYIIFWDPQVQGVRPPGYLKSGERVGEPQGRVAPMPQALVADAPPGYHKKMSREYMNAYFRNLTASLGENGIPGEGNMIDTQPTPRVLPVAPENNNNNYQNIHHGHHNGDTTSAQSNDNYQSSGPSPQQGSQRDSSPSGDSYVSEDIRQQQQHGQPPLPSSA